MPIKKAKKKHFEIKLKRKRIRIPPAMAINIIHLLNTHPNYLSTESVPGMYVAGFRVHVIVDLLYRIIECVWSLSNMHNLAFHFIADASHVGCLLRNLVQLDNSLWCQRLTRCRSS